MSHSTHNGSLQKLFFPANLLVYKGKEVVSNLMEGSIAVTHRWFDAIQLVATVCTPT